MAAFTTMGDVLSSKDVEEIVAAAERTAEGHIEFNSLVKLLCQ